MPHEVAPKLHSISHGQISEKESLISHITKEESLISHNFDRHVINCSNEMISHSIRVRDLHRAYYSYSA